MDTAPNTASHVEAIPGRVARVILDRPPLNVLDIPMMEQLDRALRTVNQSNPAVVVLEARGRAFSAGVDVADHTAY